MYIDHTRNLSAADVTLLSPAPSHRRQRPRSMSAPSSVESDPFNNQCRKWERKLPWSFILKHPSAHDYIYLDRAFSPPLPTPVARHRTHGAKQEHLLANFKDAMELYRCKQAIERMREEDHTETTEYALRHWHWAVCLLRDGCEDRVVEIMRKARVMQPAGKMERPLRIELLFAHGPAKRAAWGAAIWAESQRLRSEVTVDALQLSFKRHFVHEYERALAARPMTLNGRDLTWRWAKDKLDELLGETVHFVANDDVLEEESDFPKHRLGRQTHKTWGAATVDGAAIRWH